MQRELVRSPMPFLLVFLIISLIELFVFLSIGSLIGIGYTLLLCILTAVIGGYLIKRQGMEAFAKARQEFSTGKMPVNALFDGLCLFLAGAFLLTPGFVTDILGFFLLIPILRSKIKAYLGKSGKFEFKSSTRTPHNDDIIIEGEYENVTQSPSELQDNKKNKEFDNER